MTLLHWNVRNLVLFVESHWWFLYTALTILSSLSHSSIHHATVGFLFVSEDVLGMVLSAACMVLTWQLCASSIMVWLSENFHDHMTPNMWPPNSPDFNPMDYYV